LSKKWKKEKTSRKKNSPKYIGPSGKQATTISIKKMLPRLMEKSSLSKPTVTDNRDLAEECRKALEQSYGCPIPLPKQFRQKPKLTLAENQTDLL